MTADYVIIKKLRLVRSVGSGVLTFQDVRAHQDRLLSDPEFEPAFDQLIDLTTVPVVEISVEQARILATRRMFSATSKRAFVATEPAVFGMSRMIEAYIEMSEVPSHTRSFYDLPSALNWLDLDSLPDEC